MKKFLGFASALAISAFTVPVHAATYYVAANGSDSNSGLSKTAPWKTIAKVNSQAAAGAFNASDSILFRRGDTWHEMLLLGSTYNSTSSDTLTSAPLPIAGSPGKPITFGSYGLGAQPIIDAADRLSVTWTSQGGGVYSAPLPAAGMPGKVFVDALGNVTTQLLPVPNSRGMYSASATYQPMDQVQFTRSDSNIGNVVHGMGAATTGVSPTSGLSSTWTTDFLNLNLSSCGNGCYAQTFSTTNTGQQNVAAIPGSWYSDGTTIWVHLSDGSNPSSHIITGTYRPYGVLMESVNYVTVTGLTVAHAQKSCIAAVAYSSDQGGSYMTNIGNTIVGNTVWNCGDYTLDNLPLQGSTNIIEAGILLRASGALNPSLLTGDRISSNYVWTFDTYNGLRGGTSTYQTGISMLGIDGGGTSNNYVIDHNFVKTIFSRAIVYNTDQLQKNTSLLNNGGRVAWNEITGVQDGLFFGFISGGRVDHNHIHAYKGEGVQLGGGSIGPTLVDHNIIANGTIDDQNVGYNGVDCNGGHTLVTDNANTVYNPWGSAFTFETGCTGGTITNNLVINKATLWPSFTTANNSYFWYFQSTSHDGTDSAGNNYLQNSTTPNPFHVAGGTSYSLGAYAAGWPDSTSKIGGDPLFVAPETINGQRVISYKLKAGSPAATVGAGGVPAGAYDGTANAMDLTQVGPTGTTYGAVYGQQYGTRY